MRTRRIGAVSVGAIGLGAMPLSIEGRPDRTRAIATVHAALDAGVTLIDTADAYHHHANEVGHNEELVAEVLASYGGDVLVATKGGRRRPGDGSWTNHGSPADLKRACAESLKRLGVEAIGLYQLHKPDPLVPWAESVGALRDLLDEGKIRMAGISNVDTDQIRQAARILGGGLVSVQNRFAPADQTSTPELQLCTELGLAFLPWSPLSGIARSSLDGPSTMDSLGALMAFHDVAHGHGVSPQQVCLAWLLATSPVVIPIPGASRPATIRDSAAAVDLELTSAELRQLDEAVTATSSTPRSRSGGRR